MIDLRIRMKQGMASRRPAFSFDIAGRYAEQATANRGLLLPVLLIGMLFATSCDKAYELKMSNCEGTLSLPCGSVTIKTKIMGKTLFIINQEYSLTKELWVDPDSLAIVYKSENLDFELWRNDIGKKIENRTIITSKTALVLYFSVFPPVSKGDTVFIAANGFLNCQGHSVLTDTISIFVDR